jgi:hypothetical protein
MSTDLTVFDAPKAALAEMKLKIENTIFPCETPDDIKAIRSFCAKFSKINGEIDRRHKDAKSQALEIGRAYDAEKKTLKAAVAEMRETVFAPVKEIEDREAAAKQAALDKLEEERTAKAEADQKELDELRKAKEESDRKEREANIAEKAAASAIAKAKQDKIDTAARAKRSKEKAVAKVQADAQAVIDKAASDAKDKEDARIAEENKVKAEKEAADKVATDRIADTKHRDQIETEIHEALKELPFDPEDAKLVLDAIVAGEIPHVTINY